MEGRELFTLKGKFSTSKGLAVWDLTVKDKGYLEPISPPT